MPAWLKIKNFLTPSMRLTTAQLATQFSYSVGHIGRVMVWMDQNGHAAKVSGSSPYLWSGI